MTGRIDREPVDFEILGGVLRVVWEGICLLADVAGELPWTVVGGQMVFLHGAEHGESPHRVSGDIDTAVDIRADQKALRQFVTVLGEHGFVSEGASPDGHAYRFTRPQGPDGRVGDGLTVDVLAPEGLGARADLRTVGSGTAFPAAGARQALDRTAFVPVNLDGVHWVPRPSLLGAVVAKAAAAGVDHDPERHLADAAFLCGLIEDPFMMQSEVSSKDRKRLRVLARLLGENERLWGHARNPVDAGLALQTLVSV